MADPTFGSEYVYNSGTSQNSKVTKLDDTHIVVVYLNASGYPYAVVGTIANDDEITWGTPVALIGSNTVKTQFGICTLDSTHFVVSYARTSGDDGRSIVGVVSSGDTITFGTEVQFDGDCNYIENTALDSTHFVVASQNSNVSTATVGTVTGDSISYGSEYSSGSGNNSWENIEALDSTHFVMTWRAGSAGNAGQSSIGVVSSGNVVTFGSVYTYNSGATFFTGIGALSATKFILAYTDVDNSNKGTAIIGDVANGDEITYGSETITNNASTAANNDAVAIIDSTNAIIIFEEGSGNTEGKAISASISETTITLGNEIQYNGTSGTYQQDTIGIGDGYFAIVFRDGGNSEYGTGIIGFLASPILIDVSDTVSITDSISISTTTNVAISDTVNTSDNLSAGKLTEVLIQSTVLISDAIGLSAIYSLIVSSTITVVDSVLAKLPWIPRTKPTTSFTDRTKPETSFSDRNKPTTNWNKRT